VAASPLARRRARELGIELAGVVGSGPRGAVRARDLAQPSPAARTPGAAPPTPASVRRRIALAMERSKREIPHYYLQSELDMSGALRWLADANGQRPLAERLIPAALLLRAVARAAAAVPELNGHSLDRGRLPAG
jgi:pyruvate dehydrogenase E2 component (dihydrolipoamide acetyltransferase)